MLRGLPSHASINDILQDLVVHVSNHFFGVDSVDIQVITMKMNYLVAICPFSISVLRSSP